MPVPSGTPPVGVTCPGGDWGVAPRNGPIIDLSGAGVRTTVYDNGATLSNGDRIYAGLANAGDLTIWRVPDNPTNSQEKRAIEGIGNADDITWYGGRNKPTYLVAGTTRWDSGSGSLAPEYHGNIGLVTGLGQRQLILSFSVDNVGDGVAIGDDGNPFGDVGDCDDFAVVRCCLEGCRDDGVQNDWKNNGTVCDSFVSAMMGFAARPAAGSSAASTSASGQIFTIQNNLVWIKAQQFPDLAPFGGSLGDPCVFSMIKIQVNVGGDGGLAKGMSFEMHDNVWLWKGELSENTSNGGILTSTDASKIVSQSGNILLLPNQSSGFPPSWPTSSMTGFDYIYSTEAEAYWNDVMSDWETNHPEINVQDPGYF